MSDPIPLTSRYADVFVNGLGLGAEARGESSVIIELGHGLRVVARHFAPSRPDLLQLSATFASSRDRIYLSAVFARLNPALKGAKFLPAHDGESYNCVAELIVAPCGEEPTAAHLKNVLPRALGTVTYAIASLAKEFAEVAGDGDDSAAA